VICRDHVTKRDHLTEDLDQKQQGEFVRGCGNAMFVVGEFPAKFIVVNITENFLLW
jgi:hypothetical protein